jgi:hypothetical protein
MVDDFKIAFDVYPSRSYVIDLIKPFAPLPIVFTGDIAYSKLTKPLKCLLILFVCLPKAIQTPESEHILFRKAALFFEILSA